MIFPQNFNLLNIKFFINELEVPALKVYYTNENTSLYAKNIFDVFIDEINVRINTKGEVMPLTIKEEILGIEQSEPYRYRDYLFPAIILMSILTVAVFNMPFDFSFNVEKGIFKKIKLFTYNK